MRGTPRQPEGGPLKALRERPGDSIKGAALHIDNIYPAVVHDAGLERRVARCMRIKDCEAYPYAKRVEAVAELIHIREALAAGGLPLG